MAEIYVDPWIFALPATGRDPGDADNYVDSITRIHTLAVNGTIVGAVTAYAAELLEADELFPLIDRMDPTVWPHRRDIWKLVASILSRLSSIEDEDNVSAVLMEELGEAELPLHLIPTARALSHRGELIARSLSHSRRQRLEIGPMLLTPIDCGSVEVANIRCTIIDADVKEPRASPVGVHIGTVSFGSCPRELTSFIEPSNLWLLGLFSEALSLAVYLAKPDEQCWPPSRIDWTFGKSFIDSVRALHFDNQRQRAEVLLRACVEVILGQNRADTHVLRTGRGGNDPQMTRARDKAGAWRRDIDYEFHLHYWRINNSTEFAAVVVHNDFSIP